MIDTILAITFGLGVLTGFLLAIGVLLFLGRKQLREALKQFKTEKTR